MTRYKEEPKDGRALTDRLDQSYTKYATLYDIAVKALPVWKTWLKTCLPHLRGPRVLEASFGTGFLMTQYADKYDTFGIDYNAQMIETTAENLRKRGLRAQLRQANVEDLPFEDGYFDTVLNTFAFSGYPHADKAMSELRRVLSDGGRMVLLDFDYPSDGNFLGTRLAKLMDDGGDIVRNMGPIFERHQLTFDKRVVGGFGSVLLYIAQKVS